MAIWQVCNMGSNAHSDAIGNSVQIGCSEPTSDRSLPRAFKNFNWYSAMMSSILITASGACKSNEID
jgi:hypothetical protein